MTFLYPRFPSLCPPLPFKTSLMSYHHSQHLVPGNQHVFSESSPLMWLLCLCSCLCSVCSWHRNGQYLKTKPHKSNHGTLQNHSLFSPLHGHVIIISQGTGASSLSALFPIHSALYSVVLVALLFIVLTGILLPRGLCIDLLTPGLFLQVTMYPICGKWESHLPSCLVNPSLTIHDISLHLNICGHQHHSISLFNMLALLLLNF